MVIIFPEKHLLTYYLVNKTFDSRVNASPDHHNLSNSYIRITDKGPNKIYFETIDDHVLSKKDSNQSLEKNNNNTKNCSSLDKLKKPIKIMEKKVNNGNNSRPHSKTKITPDHQKIRPILNSIGRGETPQKYRNSSNKSNIRGANPQTNKSLNINRGSYSQEKENFDKLQQCINEVSHNFKSPERDTVNITQGKDLSLEKKRNEKLSTTKKESKFDEFNKLTDKEIAEMNKSLLGFYDLLIERDQSNSKLLCNLKENFSLFMKEFKNNVKLKKQYEQENGYYKEQLEITIREKNQLQTQLELLKQEHEILARICSNKILIPNSQSENSLSAAEISKSKLQQNDQNIGSSTNGLKLQNLLHKQTKDDLAHEHKKMLFLLQKQQNMIYVMKKKEAKYIKLLTAIKQKGTNIEEIYNHNVKTSSSETLNTSKISRLDHSVCPTLIEYEDQLIESSNINEIIEDIPIALNKNHEVDLSISILEIHFNIV